jgi:tetratricopeptide (TPR) repeat protein
MREVEVLFRTAVRHHQAGQPTEAERCCRQVLVIDGRHADSLHLLGIVASQTGRHGEAIKLIDRAIQIRNDVPAYHNNLGSILRSQGNLANAAMCYRRALTLKPDYAEAHNNLGNTLRSQGDLAAAVSHYERALALNPVFAEAHTNLGNALFSQGKLADAIPHYKRAISLKPDFVEAHFELGNALENLGDTAVAMIHYERAVEIKPDFAEAHNNLGNILLSRGKLAEATRSYERALGSKPDAAEAHFNLANSLRKQGRYEEAMVHYGRAIVLKPGFAEAHYNLGNVFKDQGRNADAGECYTRAIEIKPDFPEAHNHLGNVLLHQGKPMDALAHYERSVALKPDFPEAHYNMGNVLQSRGELMRAVTCYERAIALKPDFAEARHNLGNTLLDQGKLEEARLAYEEAISLAPKSGRFYRSLVKASRVVTKDHHLEAMERLARDIASLSITDQIELHFALGNAYTDLEQHDRSFSHLLEGNALKRRELGYDEATTLGVFDRMRAVFTADLMSGMRGAGDASKIPIFIVGMLRSGTTLVEQILASHPKVYGAGELRHFSHLAASLPGFPEIVRGLSAERLRQLGASYVDAVRAMAPEAERITDKMPGNFALAGLIHLALPNARIIHMRRDPIDTCLSCFSILFTNGQPYSYDLVELGRYYKAYEELMEHWRSVLPPGVMLEVHYEDVVSDLERQVRRVVAHCGLEWNDACLEFHEVRRTVRTASAAQVREPIYRSSMGRWRRYQELLRPLITELGPTEAAQ